MRFGCTSSLRLQPSPTGIGRRPSKKGSLKRRRKFRSTNPPSTPVLWISIPKNRARIPEQNLNTEFPENGHRESHALPCLTEVRELSAFPKTSGKLKKSPRSLGPFSVSSVLEPLLRDHRSLRPHGAPGHRAAHTRPLRKFGECLVPEFPEIVSRRFKQAAMLNPYDSHRA